MWLCPVVVHGLDVSCAFWRRGLRIRWSLEAEAWHREVAAATKGVVDRPAVTDALALRRQEPNHLCPEPAHSADVPV